MKFIIQKDKTNIKIKDFLKEKKISTNLLKRLKRVENGITVNGLHQNVNYKLAENDILELNIDDFDQDENKYLEPWEVEIDVIYEDDNLTVINKPSNMPTHESINNRGNTLANALRYRYKDKSYVFRATNRLDKDTSGIVITANNRFYASLLSNKIKQNEIKKEYIAVVEGELSGSGFIDAPIDRVGESIIKREVRNDGEEAKTEYTVLASSKDASVVSLKPITGRTHQLRVHMAYIGHPIIGDTMYGRDSKYINRHALHCLKMNVKDIGKYYAPIPTDIKLLINQYFKNEDIILKQ